MFIWFKNQLGAKTLSLDEDTKRFYDATAEETAEQWYPNDILMPTIQEFLSYLPANPRILDLGCGPGHESMRLASQGARVLGIDFSSECIRTAKNRCPECQFEVGDIRHLDARYGQFHGVFAAGSLIHVNPDELPIVMDLIADVLELGGCLLAIVQKGEGFRESWPVVDQQKMRRILYLYRGQDLDSTTSRLKLCGQLKLARELHRHGWRAYLLNK